MLTLKFVNSSVSFLLKHRIKFEKINTVLCLFVKKVLNNQIKNGVCLDHVYYIRNVAETADQIFYVVLILNNSNTIHFINFIFSLQ